MKKLTFCCALFNFFIVLFARSIPCGPNIINLIAGSPFPTGGMAFGTWSVAFCFDGKLLATANGNNNAVSVFQVAANGTLAPVMGSPFMSGDEPIGIAFNPDGTLLASANNDGGDVTIFQVASDGALTEVGTTMVGTTPFDAAFSPNGKLLAVAKNEGVTMFQVASNGALTTVGTFFSVGNSASVSFNPDGTLLAVANIDDSSVTMFQVALDGMLTPITGSPFSVRPGAGGLNSGPSDVTFSPDGELLATANFLGNNVTVFQVASNGALTSVDGSPFPVAGVVPFSVAFSPDRKLLASADLGSSSITVFEVFLNGRLSRIGSFSAAGDCINIEFSPGGNFLATANLNDNTVSMFCVNNNRNPFVEALFTKYQPVRTIQ